MNLFENLQIMKENHEKTFNVSYKDNEVYQTILVKAYDEEQALEFFKEHKPKAEIYGINVATRDDERPGKPVLNATLVETTTDYNKNKQHVESINSENTITEDIELRPFTKQDWYGFQGCNNFKDGSEPLVAYGDYATLIVDGTEGANISIYYGEDNDKWCFKTYDDKDAAIKDAKFLLKLIEDEIDEEQLKRFGFTKV